MKQLVLMIVLTAFGALGALFNGPFWGLAVYYLFAVLRPQFLWKWTLPMNVQWSFYVALPTIFATALHGLGFYHDPEEPAAGKRFVGGHLALLGFAVSLFISYLLAYNPRRATPVVIEYSKIFTMIAISAFIVRQMWQIRVLMFVATLSLIYIAYEVNYLYLVNGYLGIYLNGYGGLDNNGAGLMLAMAVPICIFIWESHRRIWRWFFAAMVPVLLHAVLMTYSRGRDGGPRRDLAAHPAQKPPQEAHDRRVRRDCLRHTDAGWPGDPPPVLLGRAVRRGQECPEPVFELELRGSPSRRTIRCSASALATLRS